MRKSCSWGYAYPFDDNQGGLTCVGARVLEMTIADGIGGPGGSGDGQPRTQPPPQLECQRDPLRESDRLRSQGCGAGLAVLCGGGCGSSDRAVCEREVGLRAVAAVRGAARGVRRGVRAVLAGLGGADLTAWQCNVVYSSGRWPFAFGHTCTCTCHPDFKYKWLLDERFCLYGGN